MINLDMVGCASSHGIAIGGIKSSSRGCPCSTGRDIWCQDDLRSEVAGRSDRELLHPRCPRALLHGPARRVSPRQRQPRPAGLEGMYTVARMVFEVVRRAADGRPLPYVAPTEGDGIASALPGTNPETILKVVEAEARPYSSSWVGVTARRRRGDPAEVDLVHPDALLDPDALAHEASSPGRHRDVPRHVGLLRRPSTLAGTRQDPGARARVLRRAARASVAPGDAEAPTGAPSRSSRSRGMFCALGLGCAAWCSSAARRYAPSGSAALTQRGELNPESNHVSVREVPVHPPTESSIRARRSGGHP